jgi:hypothetical protein
MVAFTTGTWYSGQSAARPERQYHHVQLLYISLENIHVLYCEQNTSDRVDYNTGELSICRSKVRLPHGLRHPKRPMTQK